MRIPLAAQGLRDMDDGLQKIDDVNELAQVRKQGPKYISAASASNGPSSRVRLGRIASVPVLIGLHHSYTRVAI